MLNKKNNMRMIELKYTLLLLSYKVSVNYITDRMQNN